MKVCISFLGFLLFVFSCNTSKKISNNQVDEIMAIPNVVEGCNAIAKVKNFTHEAGCQYLLELEDGSLLLPGELPVTKTPFFEGAGVKIGYEILDKDNTVVVQSTCKSYDYIVKITCIEQFIIAEDGIPQKHDECKVIKNPYTFTWMREAIAKHNPAKVNEYEYSIGYIYEFKLEDGSILYDCLGNFMCNSKDNSDCSSLLETLENPSVILVVNN